tara:strand:- start:837 stop:1325 length:489 start_codon:yes stop_codon:yes gene_type:complete
MGRKTTHKSKSHKRGPVRSKKVIYDGITFASGLERYMWQALKKSKIKATYESETFILQEGFMCDLLCYERQGNGKGDMINRGEKKILPIKYTPDFFGEGFIIETKGRANESFPMRWKMFKKLINSERPHVTLYKPQNHKECDKVVELILNKRKNEKNIRLGN